VVFLAVITALSLGGLLTFYSSYLDKRSTNSRSTQSEAPLKIDTEPQLLPGPKPELTISVTENTTELLENDEITKSEQSKLAR
ncbi:MAG: hypothetical protein WAV47_27710, partial [Blastocatellia bacterium]